MRVLVLGGTRFVGRAVVQDALVRGWQVTALNRGVTGTLPAGVTPLTVDRTDAQALADALQGREFDLVVDTWSGAPNVVRTAAQIVTTRRFCYVSSISAYVDGRPPGGDETWPVHDADPTAEATEYGADKRGGELAALESFPDAVLARCGLILGPWENVGRLPWWLDRAARGGRMVAPGRPGQPVQWIDVRDLAAWVNDALTSDVSGPVDLTSPPGHTTWGEVLEAVLDATDRRAELVWRDQDTVLAAGAEPWTQLPIWVPEGGEWTGFMDGSTEAAVRTGLRSRSIAETARDTWAWIGTDGMPTPPAHRPQPGLPEKLETALLA